MEENNQNSPNPFARETRKGSDLENHSDAEANPVVESSREDSSAALRAATLKAMSLSGSNGDSKGSNGRNANGSEDLRSQKLQSPAVGGAMAIGSGNEASRMETVVDLLFGNHLEEINTGMRNLEKQLSSQVRKVEEDVRVRIESIDRRSKEQLDALGKLIERETAGREEGEKTINDRVTDAVQKMEGRIEKMDTAFTQNLEQARGKIEDDLAQGRDISEAMRLKMEEEIAGMKASLSSKQELSGMFAELAKRLEH